MIGVLTGMLAERKDINCAFIFGSFASGQEKSSSDIDLMVIGSIGLRTLTTSLTGVNEQCGREINSHVLSPKEFAMRLQRHDHFLANSMLSK
ncbi:MAG: nucleotidyltransferase domain-containing protein [Desulforudis sp.]|nr:MAG: nucleotidyltransferase domain-containing protein [Desulforudis sp.]